MRKFLSMLTACLLASASLTASWSSWYSDLFSSDGSNCCGSDWPSPFNMGLAWGYRQDKFKWSIAGNRRGSEKGPNILSELKWDDLRISQISGAAEYVSWRNYAVFLGGDYGNIYHGNNSDADFARSNRRGLFSLSRNDAGKGYVYDINGGVGYRVISTCGRFVATPLVGYAWHGQQLHIFDGNQVIDKINCEIGPFPGLDSKYKARWYGPWVGIDFDVQVECCAYLFGGFEWNWTRYRATGCWNLRSDLGPFQHHAYGHGYVVTLGGNWEIWRHFSIGIVGNCRHFRTGSGRESIAIIHGPECVENVRSRFNGAKWKSYSISGIIAWRF